MHHLPRTALLNAGVGELNKVVDLHNEPQHVSFMNHLLETAVFPHHS